MCQEFLPDRDYIDKQAFKGAERIGKWRQQRKREYLLRDSWFQKHSGYYIIFQGVFPAKRKQKRKQKNQYNKKGLNQRRLSP